MRTWKAFRLPFSSARTFACRGSSGTGVQDISPGERIRLERQSRPNARHLQRVDRDDGCMERRRCRAIAQTRHGLTAP